MKQIDVGGMSFAELREKDKYYVDKTLLIKDILESNSDGVYLFARPRRFGKTTNMSMLDAFFNIQFKGNTWFDGLAISGYPEFGKFKNAFPVIHLDLGIADADSYPEFLDGLRKAVGDAFEPHRYLLEWPELSDTLRNLFRIFGDETIPLSESMLKLSVNNLSAALAKYHRVSPIILIDEYDRAVTNAFGEGSHKDIMSFLAKFMYASIKGNPYRGMIYVTGVMQIAKQTIFSGLNNIVVNNVFSEDSDERFGFTESEVQMILGDYGRPEKMDEIREWYDGYRFGNAEVYNPYSVMNYVSRKFKPEPYWIDSGSDVAIMQLLKSLNDATYADVQDLVSGGSIETDLESRLSYGEIATSGVALYSLMAVSGYLKAIPLGDRRFRVSVPNNEVRGAVDRMMRRVYPISDSSFNDFNRAVLEGDSDTMVKVLQRIMLQSSYMNLAENTYQAVVMTIMHGLSRMYEVRTESEEGLGRVDIILRSRVEGRENMIFELKIADSEEELDAGVDEAMKQIHDRRYYLGMPGKVILVGLAFYKKIPKGRIEIIDNGPDGTAMLGKSA